MEETITEKTYPIQNTWLLKRRRILHVLIALLAYFIIINKIKSSIEFPITPNTVIFYSILLILALVFVTVIPIIVDVFRRANFHYSLDEHFMVLHQGIISKQNRNVPYGRIQGVFVNQDLFDRIFGLASLTIEDFSDSGMSIMNASGYVPDPLYSNPFLSLLRISAKKEVFMFLGNKIHIPGLKKGDAEALKVIILQKIKENPIEDSQSGL